MVLVRALVRRWVQVWVPLMVPVLEHQWAKGLGLWLARALVAGQGKLAEVYLPQVWVPQ